MKTKKTSDLTAGNVIEHMGGFRLVSEVRLVWVNHRLLYLVLCANDGIPVVFRGGHRVTVHGWVAPEDLSLVKR